MDKLVIIIPVYRDDASLRQLLTALQMDEWPGRLIVVDGEANPTVREFVEATSAEYLTSTRGRGQQIARGVSVATGWVLVLHADSSVNLAMRDAIVEVIAGEPCWGRFDIDIEGLPLVATGMNLRSRLTKICTGDQGMFFHRSLLTDFPDQPLMEDIELSKRLKRSHSDKFFASRVRIETSGRRWRQNGVVRTVVNMWFFRARYYFGASASDLYAEYYGID